MMKDIKVLMNDLMNEHGDYLKRTAVVMVGDYQIAEDLVQETFISFYKKRLQFNHQSSYKTYLYRILMNHIKMYFRKKRDYTMEPSVFEYHGMVEFENQAIRTIDLKQALEKLKPDYRNVIVLYFFNEMKIEEIASVLDITKSGVKMRLKRAKAMLYGHLNKGGNRNEKVE